MYAHLLPAPLRVLLYVVECVWVVLTVFFTPTRQTEGGFRFLCPRRHFWKLRQVPTYRH
jgi:hypothetical protein